MKKTILALSMVALGIHSVMAKGLTGAEIAEKRLAWDKNYFSQKGMPAPDGGITIVPQSKMQADDAFKKMMLKQVNDKKTLGYINEKSDDYDYLMKFSIIAKHQYMKYANDFNPTSTHLRRNIADLKMSYTFLGVPENAMSEMIGVAPYLTYIKGDGWVGAVQFFKNMDGQTCEFMENNVRLSHGSVILAKEDVSEAVNSKITFSEVQGTKNDGFVYTVEWYDPVFFRTLKCADKEYSENMSQKMIELAKQIDSNNNAQGNS